MTDDRPRVLRRVGVLLLAVNVGLALLKGWAWVASGSLAVEGEAEPATVEVVEGPNEEAEESGVDWRSNDFIN
jgi:divalent metal cation (Fe/Co/Zn/Cd) transporter